LRKIEDISETLTTEIKELKKNPSEMKNTINEIGNKCDAMNIRLEETEKGIGDLEDKVMEKVKLNKR